MKKQEIYVVVDTPKKAKKLKKVLDMFNERIYEKTNKRLTKGEVSEEYRNVHFLFNNEWVGDSRKEGISSKTEVSIKELKNILSSENLKKGDYVVCEEKGSVAVGIFKEWDSHFGFDIDNCRYKDGLTSDGGCFDNFKRYATPEEIALLEPKEVDKFAELKEAHKNGAVIEYKSSQTGFWHKATSPSWDNNTEYRIKPEEKPKIGDVCKFWDDDEDVYLIGCITDIDISSSFPFLIYDYDWFRNAKTLTQQEAIDLLFNNK